MSMEVKNVSEMYTIPAPVTEKHKSPDVPIQSYFPAEISPVNSKLKRFIDISASLVILMIFSPVWIAVSILVKLDSNGPIIYRQRRIGVGGRPFTLYKFRSMIHNAEKMTGPVWAKRNDRRITRIGRIIRKLGIDEIPNLINVVRGDMSLIGPRPERPYFVNQFRHRIHYYTQRLEVRPGITGLAQIYHKYDESIDDVKRKLEYDLQYIREYSPLLDVKIIFMTFYIITMGKGRF